MATDIGVRIGLEGEAEYKRTIKDIIAEQKALAAEMKATESAFDKNASAQEKATAKAENLNKRIENQKTYVEKLKEQLEKAKETYDDNSATVSKLRENLAKAETALNKMESEQKDLNETIKKAPYEEAKKKAEELGKKLDDVGGKMKTVGDNMTKYVTGPLAAFAGLSVKAWKDVDDAMDEMVKMTGKTGQELQGLQDIAKDLSTTLPVSLEDSAKAVAEVNTRFDASGEKASELASQYLKFANITGTDVVDAIDSTQHALAAWGLSADQAGTMMDVLLQVSQDTGASVDTLAAGIADNKTIFDQMGMSVYTAAGFLGQLDKNGVDSSAAMAGLKKALQNATKEGKPLDQALKELDETLTSGNTDTEAYADAMELFGNKAGPQLADAVRSGRLSLTDFARVASDSMGSVDQTFEDMLDPADKFTTTMNQLKLTGAEVGATLLDALAPVLVQVAEALKSVAEWWSGLSPTMQNTILIIGGIVAAIGPVVSIVGNIITVVGALIPVIAAATAAIGAMDIALGPILLIVGAIAAAIAAVILVIKNWGAITEWFSGVWTKVTGWVKKAAEDVGNWVSDKWEKVTSWTKEAWGNVKEWTSEAWDKVKSTVSNVAESVKQNVVDKWNMIKETTSTAWSAIKSKVEENGGGIKGVLATFTEGYKTMWSNAFQAINNATGGKLGEALTTVQNKLQAIKDKFTSIFESIKNFVKNAIDKIKSFFNFSWSLPKIKLPHFKITGSFSLSPPSIPRITVDWYRKAYDQPMMFTRPTILGTASGLKGFGDGSGGEIVIGQNMMARMIQDAVRGAGGRESNYTIDITVNGAAGQSVDDLAEAISERLTFEIQRREAALA